MQKSYIDPTKIVFGQTAGLIADCDAETYQDSLERGLVAGCSCGQHAFTTLLGQWWALMSKNRN